MDVETILFDKLYAETPPERHGQLCPVWTRRKYRDRGKVECDCWVADQDHRLARRLAAALRAEQVERPDLDVDRLAEALYLTLGNPVTEPFHGDGDQRLWVRHARTVAAYLSDQASERRTDG